MATAVLDVTIDALPRELTGLHDYSKAFVLLRYKRLPVAKLLLPVVNGRITFSDHYNEMLASAPLLSQIRLKEYLQWDEYAAIDFKPPPATIAICTRNRTDDLRRCLQALTRLPDDGQEILVIDNCPSTNDTQKLVEAYKNVRYILENKPGLNAARNRALLEAKHEVVAFTDDDATPDPEWLQALLRNFNSPLVACVTGLTMPLELETEAQEIFERYSPFGKGFVRKVHSSSTRNPLATGEVGAGANMALRKNIYHDIGLFDDALDAGTPTQSGGDHEYFARILVAGYQIIYEPAAVSWHRHRRTWKELIQVINGYGTGVYAFWTRTLLVNREFGILKFPWYWFRHVQLRHLFRALLQKPGSYPLDLILAELKGCARGPWAYLASRRGLKNKKNDHDTAGTYS